MVLTRAQQRVMAGVKRAHEVPYEQRTSATFRFSGRGMERTLIALQRIGLVQYDIHERHTGRDFFVYATTAGVQYFSTQEVKS